MTETIESLDGRIKNLEARIDIVVDSIKIILQRYENTERVRNALHGNTQYTSEDIRQLGYNVAYLEDIGDGDAY